MHGAIPVALLAPDPSRPPIRTYKQHIGLRKYQEKFDRTPQILLNSRGQTSQTDPVNPLRPETARKTGA